MQALKVHDDLVRAFVSKRLQSIAHCERDGLLTLLQAAQVPCVRANLLRWSVQWFNAVSCLLEAAGRVTGRHRV